MDGEQIEDWRQGQQLFKFREAARILGVDPSTVYRKIRDGHIEATATAIGPRITANELRRIAHGGEPKNANKLRGKLLSAAPADL